jgi:hypothetical protein
MDEDQLFLRPMGPPAPADPYAIRDDLNFIKSQLSPVRRARLQVGLKIAALLLLLSAGAAMMLTLGVGAG